MATDWRGYDATHADADDPYTAAARSYEGIGVGLQSEFEQLSIDQHTLVNDLLYEEDDASSTEGDVGGECACAYCGISNIECLARCVKTNKWFCNGRSNGLPASCLVYHLVRSKNKEVQLHESSPLGDMTLECYVTGATNVFNLGFIPCKDENVVVLVTREVAQTNPPSLRELNLDSSLWEALIQEKVFLPWLVKVPEDAEILRARQVRPLQVQKLEELWKTNPEAALEDVDKQDMNEELDPVALRFDDGYKYQNCFAPLIMIEAEYDRMQRESQTKDDVSRALGRRLE